MTHTNLKEIQRLTQLLADEIGKIKLDCCDESFEPSNISNTEITVVRSVETVRFLAHRVVEKKIYKAWIASWNTSNSLDDIHRQLYEDLDDQIRKK